MRVLVVGSPAGRARLRSQLHASIDVAGEFETLADARRSTVAADAVLMAASGHDDHVGAELFETEPLTSRERDVLEFLAEGLPNKAIADRLGISDQTVKFHVAAIISKLGATNRTEAVRTALQRGLITL
jgi:DNA-binding NarL/FixJ family response regulator